MSLLTICAVDVRRSEGAYEFSFWVLDESEGAGRFLCTRIAQGERDGPHSARWMSAVWLTVAGSIGRSWPLPPCDGILEVPLDRPKLAQLLTSGGPLRTIEPLAVVLLYSGHNDDKQGARPRATLQDAIDDAMRSAGPDPADVPDRTATIDLDTETPTGGAATKAPRTPRARATAGATKAKAQSET